MTFTTLAFTIYIVAILTSLSFFFIDRKKSKKLKLQKEEPISIFIPCYNDGDSLSSTIKSVYNARNPELFQLIVINDKSTDDSLIKLQKLQSEYWFTLIDNPQNLGKAKSLNEASELAIYDKILILDADTILERRHIVSMLARMQRNTRVAGCSCPYVPKNKWFIPAMSNIEYIMLDIVQGSYNLFWAIAMRWGCLIVNKEAFFKVGKFSQWMMTEDLDLAFKLNKAWYKIEQSLERVKSLVPTNFFSWWKQKMRRNSWGTHCFIKYISVWIKNPLHIILIFSFCLLLLSLVLQTALSRDVFKHIFSQANAWDGFWAVFDTKWRVEFFLTKTSYAFVSFPYVLPLITSRKNIYRILLIFPYSLIYMPIYSIVGIVAVCKWIKNYSRLEKIGKKGWNVQWS